MRRARWLAVTCGLLSIGGCTRGPEMASAAAPGSPPLPGPDPVESADEPAASAPPEPARSTALRNSPAESSPDEPGSMPSPPRYVRLAEVSLSPEVEAKLARIAEAYFRRTGKPIVLTSGTRDAHRQAQAMYDVLRLGGDVVRLYRNKDAVREVKAAYDAARLAARGPDETVAAVAAVLRAQMDRGVFVSAHLRAGAVDVRSYDMTAVERRLFLDAAREVGGAVVLEESAPPHFHLQLEEPLRASELDARRAGDPE